MSVRLKRLYNEYEAISRVFTNHPYITIKSVRGNPPENYNIEYQIKGLSQIDGTIDIRKIHLVEIILPSEYPTIEPMCRMTTPIFHPNINLNKICIADFWAAGESLIDVIIRIGKIISYQNYNIKSPLNGEAAKWAEQNMNRFPIDRADLTAERQLLESKSVVNVMETKISPKLNQKITQRVCSNCGATGADIQFKKCAKEGHIICSDCIIECQDCGKSLCILCAVNKCSKCGKVLCNKCKTTCTECGKTLCKNDICECRVCQCGASGKKVQLRKCSNGHIACPDCIFECESCGKVLCLECRFNRCPQCGKLFCIDCHKICTSDPKITEHKIDTVYKKSDKEFDIKPFVNPINLPENNTKLNNKVKKLITCKKCGHRFEDLEANFCEMCGERIF